MKFQHIKRFFFTTIHQNWIFACSALGLFLLQACGNTRDYYKIPAKVSQSTFNAVIEIPGGTNAKYEYNPIQKTFVPDKDNGKERLIDFLPYPANYGFIPSTLSNSEIGGDGDALDVLVISESETIGTVIEIAPIAILKLIDNGEMDYKIIATPVEKERRIIQAKTYRELSRNYPKLIEIIELWFLNYNPSDPSSIDGWGDEKEALNQLNIHIKN